MMETQASQGQLGAEGDCGMSNVLVPSPQSEAVTHEMEELTLQPTQSLPPLNERKNGEDTEHNMHGSSPSQHCRPCTNSDSDSNQINTIKMHLKYNF